MANYFFERMMKNTERKKLISRPYFIMELLAWERAPEVT